MACRESSIVIVSEAALVMRIADSRIDGGLWSDQIRASSQKPSVELMQLLVCACEREAKIALTAMANVNQIARLIFGLIMRTPTHTSHVVLEQVVA